jgi:hypothetical protein
MIPTVYSDALWRGACLALVLRMLMAAYGVLYVVY